jgi:voltage-gated potassium channel
MKALRKSTYQLLNLELGWQSKLLDYSLLLLILINCIAILLQSIKSLNAAYFYIFNAIEIYSVVIFSVEYLLRVWCIVENEKYNLPISGRLKYIFSVGALIDLLAIIPFYLAVIAIDLRFIRIFRLLRILRLFKVARYLHALDLISNVFKKRKAHLLITILLLLFVLIVSSTLMYYIENPYQPDKFSSILETMWWGIATLTTIGYGDIAPVTDFGKFLGAIISLIGIGIFALPTGILASGFSEELLKPEKQENCKCPHCGKEI